MSWITACVEHVQSSKKKEILPSYYAKKNTCIYCGHSFSTQVQLREHFQSSQSSCLSFTIFKLWLNVAPKPTLLLLQTTCMKWEIDSFLDMKMHFMEHVTRQEWDALLSPDLIQQVEGKEKVRVSLFPEFFISSYLDCAMRHPCNQTIKINSFLHENSDLLFQVLYKGKWVQLSRIDKTLTELIANTLIFYILKVSYDRLSQILERVINKQRVQIYYFLSCRSAPGKQMGYPCVSLPPYQGNKWSEKSEQEPTPLLDQKQDNIADHLRISSPHSPRPTPPTPIKYTKFIPQPKLHQISLKHKSKKLTLTSTYLTPRSRTGTGTRTTT